MAEQNKQSKTTKGQTKATNKQTKVTKTQSQTTDKKLKVDQAKTIELLQADVNHLKGITEKQSNEVIALKESNAKMEKQLEEIRNDVGLVGGRASQAERKVDDATKKYESELTGVKRTQKTLQTDISNIFYFLRSSQLFSDNFWSRALTVFGYLLAIQAVIFIATLVVTLFFSAIS